MRIGCFECPLWLESTSDLTKAEVYHSRTQSASLDSGHDVGSGRQGEGKKVHHDGWLLSLVAMAALIIWNDMQQPWMTRLSVHFLQLKTSILEAKFTIFFGWPRYLRTRITKIHILAGVVQAIDLSCKKRRWWPVDGIRSSHCFLNF